MYVTIFFLIKKIQIKRAIMEEQVKLLIGISFIITKNG